MKFARSLRPYDRTRYGIVVAIQLSVEDSTVLVNLVGGKTVKLKSYSLVRTFGVAVSEKDIELSEEVEVDGSGKVRYSEKLKAELKEKTNAWWNGQKETASKAIKARREKAWDASLAYVVAKTKGTISHLGSKTATDLRQGDVIEQGRVVENKKSHIEKGMQELTLVDKTGVKRELVPSKTRYVVIEEKHFR